MTRREKISRFEDLIAWQKAMDLSLLIYRNSSPRNFSNDHALINQIRRASVSIMSNIAEGFGRYGPREFANYLSIACGSAFEVRSQIRLAKELDYISRESTDELVHLCDEVIRLIIGLRRSLKTDGPKL